MSEEGKVVILEQLGAGHQLLLRCGVFMGRDVMLGAGMTLTSLLSLKPIAAFSCYFSHHDSRVAFGLAVLYCSIRA